MFYGSGWVGVSLAREAFEDCLERYADVFHAPLFKPSWVWNEVPNWV